MISKSMLKILFMRMKPHAGKKEIVFSTYLNKRLFKDEATSNGKEQALFVIPYCVTLLKTPSIESSITE